MRPVFQMEITASTKETHYEYEISSCLFLMDSGYSDADPNMMILGVFSDLMKAANQLFYATFCSRHDFISASEKNIQAVLPGQGRVQASFSLTGLNPSTVTSRLLQSSSSTRLPSSFKEPSDTMQDRFL